MTTYTVLLVLIGRLDAATEIKQEANAAKKFLITPVLFKIQLLYLTISFKILFQTVANMLKLLAVGTPSANII